MKNSSTDPNYTSKLLRFWFGSPYSFQEWWFSKNTKEKDTEIIQLFKHDYEQIATIHEEIEIHSPEHRLALIITLDQLPRNMFRGTPKAHATDSMALKLAKNGFENNELEKLNPLQRIFLMIPFMHSENLDNQKIVLEYSKSTGNENYIKSAENHYKTIEKFGRFPYRNKYLNRQSTPEEEAYLNDPETVVP